MFTKSLIAAALVVPAFALSSAAFAGHVYQGGPKSGLTARVQTFESQQARTRSLCRTLAPPRASTFIRVARRP